MSDESFFFPGADRGVLLVHGMTGTPTEMKYVGRGLADAGFTVSGMQLVGHCGTEQDLLATGWRDWYRSVRLAHDRLREQTSHVFVAGLSAGALLGLHLAAERPDSVDGVACYSTTLFYDGWNVPFGNFLLPLVLRLPWGDRYRFRERPPFGIKDERLRTYVSNQMLNGNSAAAGLPSIPGRSIRQLYGLISSVRKEARRIQTPTLLLHSVEDDLTSTKNAEWLAHRLKGPVTSVYLNDCFHMITVDKQRDEVVKHSADFFTNIADRSPRVPSTTRSPVAQ